jgi:beta-mannosidase
MPYIPSSPTSNWGHPDRFLTGNMHDWSVWHGGDNIDTLRAHVPRFATEYGFQSYPAFNTLELYSTEQDRVMGSEWMQQRQKSYKGNAPILSEVARLYGSPKDFASFLALSQIVQAQALENAVETHRTYRPQCMGSLYWQMNDCWPGPSWSTVDYLGRWKAGHFALKRLFAPVLVAVEEDGKDVVVRMASDLPYPKEATMQLRLKSFTGIILGQQDKVISIPADSSCEVFRLPLTRLASRFDRKSTLLEAVVHAGGKAIAGEAYYFVAAKDMKLPDAEFSYGVVVEGDHFLLSVEAKHLFPHGLLWP